MTSSWPVTDATGINHHHDQKVFLKGKFTSKLGQISSIYNSRDDGPTLSLTKDFLYGTKIIGSLPKLNGVDVNVTKDYVVSSSENVYIPSLLTSIGVTLPSTKEGVNNLIAIPKMAFKLSSKILNSSIGLTGKWNTKLGTPDITSECQFNKRFEIAEGMRGTVKGDIKQTILNKHWTYELPVLNVSLKASERSREHGISFNSRKGRITAFSATTLPTFLKMNNIFNLLTPMAVGLRIDKNLYSMIDKKKVEDIKDSSVRSLHLCYPLGARSKECPFALNIGIFDNDDTSVTLVRKDILDHGDKDDRQSLAAIYSLSAKWKRNNIWNGNSAPISWGAKLDLTGDIPSFPLLNLFGSSTAE